VSVPARDRSGFIDLLAQLRRRWVVVVGGGLVGLIVGVAAQTFARAEDKGPFDGRGVLLTLVIATAFGAAVGFVVGLVLVRLQPRVTTVDDIRRVTGLPVIAQLPSAVIDPDDLDDRGASHRLRTSLREAVMNARALAGGDLPTRIVLARTENVSEVSGVDGGLARALVECGYAAALVHTDFESRLFATSSTVDDSSMGLVPRSEAGGYQGVPVPDRVASSRPPERLAEVDALLGALSDRYDVTVSQASSNSHPVSLRAVAPVASAVLLVVRSNRTSAESLLSLYSELLSVGVEPLGVIVTAVAPRHRVLLRRTWLPSDFRPVPVLPGSAGAVPSLADLAVARRPDFSREELS
jgi:hypothetical protein